MKKQSEIKLQDKWRRAIHLLLFHESIRENCPIKTIFDNNQNFTQIVTSMIITFVST